MNNNEKARLRIVCLGDSITYGFPWGPEVSWVNMLSKAIDGEIINKGINGNTTWDMMNRFERAVLKYNPTHVIIMGGINDVICGESFDRITYNLKAMVNQALDAGIKVILGLPTAIDNEYWEKLVARIRNWMKELAAEKGLPVIDFAAAFFDENGNIKRELLLADGGHPDIEGYKQMFKQIDLKIFEK